MSEIIEVPVSYQYVGYTLAWDIYKDGHIKLLGKGEKLTKRRIHALVNFGIKEMQVAAKNKDLVPSV